MKALGIIGGLGPQSTLDYYQRIMALYRQRTAEVHYPELIIVSLDLRKGLDFMDANDLGGMGNFLLEAIGKLARGGADFGIISANTPHIVFDEIAPKSAIPRGRWRTSWSNRRTCSAASETAWSAAA